MVAKAENLCSSCRRYCKQPGHVVLIQCKRYYPMPKIKVEVLTQGGLWDDPGAGGKKSKKGKG